MDGIDLVEPFSRTLASLCSFPVIRRIEAGGDMLACWAGIEASGFLDALVPEVAGGAGLSLADASGLLQLLGRHCVPLPVGETMIARYLLAAAGESAPLGPIALFCGARGQRGLVSAGLGAKHFLVDDGEQLLLLAQADLDIRPTEVPASLAAWVSWENFERGCTLPRPAHGLRPLAALVRAAAIAGAAGSVLEMTTAYANDRLQFGRPIGRQQALQQNLAVMAEDVVAARIAVELACAPGLPIAVLAVAIAKSVTSRAAVHVVATAHAIHGAIGVSEEYDLQLFTRRLHEWRLADGSESYWQKALGARRIKSPTRSVDWIRTEPGIIGFGDR